MKKIIVILAVLIMAGMVYADDPNTMERPTLRNPLTKCYQPERRIMTIKFIVDEDGWTVVSKPTFFEKLKAGLVNWVLRDIKSLREEYSKKIPLTVLKTESEKSR